MAGTGLALTVVFMDIDGMMKSSTAPSTPRCGTLPWSWYHARKLWQLTACTVLEELRSSSWTLDADVQWLVLDGIAA